MERVAGDVEALHLGIADFDALFVSAGVECALDFQSGFGRGRADQFDDCDPIGERPAAPVLRDVTEQAVLYSVPLRRAWRVVVDTKHETGLVGELLQLYLPQPHARSVRAAAVRRDRQRARLGIALPPHALEPTADRLHGKLGRVAGDADADEAGVG